MKAAGMSGRKLSRAEKMIVAQANATNSKPTIVSGVKAILSHHHAEALKARWMPTKSGGSELVKGIEPAFYGHLLADDRTVGVNQMMTVVKAGLVIPDVPFRSFRPGQILAIRLCDADNDHLDEAIAKLRLGAEIGLGIDENILKRLPARKVSAVMASLAEAVPLPGCEGTVLRP